MSKAHTNGYAGELGAVIGHLRAARRVLAITGAGISADSGLPTYRGVGGLYEEQLTDAGMPIEALMSGETMRCDPALVWRYLHEIERACRGAGPNPGHRALAEMEAKKDEFWVLTQNVDGFHRDAGSRNVVEMHGNMHEMVCIGCSRQRWIADFGELDAIPPRCARCGALERPRVVLFGEMLPDAAIAAYERIMATDFDLVLSIGTTAVFPYIAAPVFKAAEAGRPTVEINPATSEIQPMVRHVLQTRAAVALPDLSAAI